MQLNIVGAGGHVGDVERANRSLKEGTGCELHKYPYRWYPREMMNGCVIKVMKDHNDLPINDGLSDMYGPGTLVKVNARPDYNRLTGLNFGDYMQVTQPVNPTNTN